MRQLIHSLPSVALLLSCLTFSACFADSTQKNLSNTNAPFVLLSEVSPSIVQDLRYATSNNFVGTPIDGYLEPVCLLSWPAASVLNAVQQEVLSFGLSLKVYDCYRPQRAVDHFARWASDMQDQQMKQRFYPEVDKARLFALGYIAEQSGHSRGSTVDITLIPAFSAVASHNRVSVTKSDCRSPKRLRYPDDSLEMGTGYDCFDPLAHTANAKISDEARRNRLLLTTVMEKHGFVNYDREWWHYTLREEPFPKTYFNIPVRKTPR